jgi:hypothetical protein
MNTTPKTLAQRQKKHKDKLADQSIKEVRGIMAHTEDHAAIREPARMLAEKIARKRAKLLAAPRAG